ncbi:hypothetical protein KC909_01420 [Candidatus Dojkabacteria bacterium]|uniref:Uncharacterized protein n=1 Tax=Candidatus Dojkabacteria bacterium TaxID=2099670 RepID=A0A955L4T2_9BACT|nr:hypothetical protein [Candidatus Dojkabacteria bacterium]
MTIIEKILIISLLIGFILIAYLAFKENVIEYIRITFKKKLTTKYTITDQLNRLDLFLEIYELSKDTKLSITVHFKDKKVFAHSLMAKQKDGEFFYYLPIQSKSNTLKPGNYELKITADSNDPVNISMTGYRSYYNNKFIILSILTLIIFSIAFTLIYVAGIAPNL